MMEILQEVLVPAKEGRGVYVEKGQLLDIVDVEGKQVGDLIAWNRANEAEYCYLEIRPTNERAFSFYRKWGFTVIGIIENYYPLEGENALVMGTELIPHSFPE